MDRENKTYQGVVEDRVDDEASYLQDRPERGKQDASQMVASNGKRWSYLGDQYTILIPDHTPVPLNPYDSVWSRVLGDKRAKALFHASLRNPAGSALLSICILSGIIVNLPILFGFWNPKYSFFILPSLIGLSIFTGFCQAKLVPATIIGSTHGLYTLLLGLVVFIGTCIVTRDERCIIGLWMFQQVTALILIEALPPVLLKQKSYMTYVVWIVSILNTCVQLVFFAFNIYGEFGIKNEVLFSRGNSLPASIKSVMITGPLWQIILLDIRLLLHSIRNPGSKVVLGRKLFKVKFPNKDAVDQYMDAYSAKLVKSVYSSKALFRKKQKGLGSGDHLAACHVLGVQYKPVIINHRKTFWSLWLGDKRAQVLWSYTMRSRYPFYAGLFLSAFSMISFLFVMLGTLRKEWAFVCIPGGFAGSFALGFSCVDITLRVFKSFVPRYIVFQLILLSIGIIYLLRDVRCCIIFSLIPMYMVMLNADAFTGPLSQNSRTTGWASTLWLALFLAGFFFSVFQDVHRASEQVAMWESYSAESVLIITPLLSITPMAFQMLIVRRRYPGVVSGVTILSIDTAYNNAEHALLESARRKRYVGWKMKIFAVENKAARESRVTEVLPFRRTPLASKSKRNFGRESSESFVDLEEKPRGSKVHAVPP